MAIAVLLGIVLFGLFVLFLVLGITKKLSMNGLKIEFNGFERGVRRGLGIEENNEPKIEKNKGKKSMIINFALSIMFLALFIVIPFSFTQIDTGEIAVIKQYGKAIGTKEDGLNFDLWFIRKYEKYDLRTQEINEEIVAYSLDAQTMTADLTIQYQIDPSKVLEINKKYGSLSVLKERISSVSIEKSKVVLASQSAMNIIENRNTLSSKLENEIQKATSEYNVNINLAIITNIDFSDAFERVVEEKMIAEQEKLKAEYEKEKAIIQAEQELEVAKKKAESEIEKAKGDSESQVLVAKAQAEAIKLKSLEIAKILGFKVEGDEIYMEGHSEAEIKEISGYLKYITYLENWNGVLPETIVGDSSSNIMLGIE